MAKKPKVGVTPPMPVNQVDQQNGSKQKLTKLERLARREQAQSIRVAAYGGTFGNAGGGAISNADSAFYSPQLSTDFLELPQSEREKRELFRFWYTCFPPGAPVLRSDGTTIPIEDVRVGDSVPNGLGEPTTVAKLFHCDISDQIVSMRVRGIQELIRATGNHPFYVLRAEQVDCKKTDATGACKGGSNSICRRTKCDGMDFGKPAFVYAKDLRVGDYVLSPPFADTVDPGLSREELRLLGYYAAEGSIAYRSAGVIRGVEFSLGIDEAKTVAAEISDLFEKVFGRRARIYPAPERSTTKVVCDGVGFARFCEKWVGRGSHEKRLDERLVKCGPEQALEFLGAYWNGDGCFTDNSYTANTMSGDLASQVFQMLRRLQIPAYHSRYDRPARIIGGRDYPAGTIHYVSFPGRFFDLFSRYANWVRGKYSASSTRIYLTSCVYGFLHRIESLETVFYEGPVYNFEVCGEGDRKSYIAHGLATHNTHPIVGAAIDFHCFPPGAPVTLKDGSVQSVELLNVGDEVLNGFGEATRVVQTFRHDINGFVTRLRVRGVQEPISCTENHPFLVYRAEKVDCLFPQHGLGPCKHGSKLLCQQKKCLGPELGSPEFVFAKDLKVGDYICSPSMSASRSSFSRAQLRLLGYYAAEGSLSRTSYGHLDRVVFTLSADEFDTLADEIASLFRDEYSHDAHKRMRSDSHSCEVRCYSRDFAEFCHLHVGEGSRSKRLSLDLVESPREDVLEFLGAYWNGDGSLTKNGYVATTASKQLAYQLFTLALKVGFEPKLRSEMPKQSETGFRHTGPIYRVIIPYRFYSEFSKYANFVQGEYQASSTREYSVRVGNHTLRRIEEVETVRYDGPVYNIEVDGEGDRKSYVAYGLVTHNTDVPMSKIRLSLPKGKDIDRNKRILHFYEQMCKRIRLFQTLYDVTHEYWLHGNCVPGDSRIRRPDGYVKASEIKVGDLVLTHNGRFKSVSKTCSRTADKILSFDVWKTHDPLRCTEEHPLEVLRDGVFCFVRASEVRAGDFLRVTWPSEELDVTHVDLLSGSPASVVDGGYEVSRTYPRRRPQAAQAARDGLLSWLSTLSGPTIRSRKELASDFGVSESTLNNVVFQLGKEIGFRFHQRAGHGKFGGGSAAEWLPTFHDIDSSYERRYFFQSPSTLAVDEDFCYLVGYWLGDGTLGRDNNRDTWGRLWQIVFGSGSDLQREKVLSILVSKLGQENVRMWERNGLHTVRVVSSPAFLEWWSSNFGDTSHGPNGKRVPSWFLNLPASKIAHAIAGLIDSDGCISQTDKGVKFSVSSRPIADFFRDACFKLGAVGNVSEKAPREVVGPDGVSRVSRTMYTITLLDKQSCSTVTKFCIKPAPDHQSYSDESPFYKRVDGGIAFKIRSVSELPGCEVFNFEVEQDHTFQVDGFSTHNCFIFCEDHDLTEEITEEMISDIKEEEVGEVDYAGRAKTRVERKKQLKPETERVKAIREHVAKNYRGWERLQILPPEQVKLEVFQYTNRAKMELIPSEKDRIVVMKAQEQHDDESARIAEDIPEQIRENLLSGQPIPLNTSPYDDFLCSSFCYHLTHKKSSYDDRGISILERCHIPGTEVTAKRDGQVLQIPIESLDPETDEILGGSGKWRKFDHGTRPVSEAITEIAVEKVLDRIRLTSDHKMSVVRDGVRKEVLARDVMPGDYVQVAQVRLAESVRSVDLAAFVRSTSPGSYVARKSGEASSLCMEVIDETDDTFTVRYSKVETDPRKASYFDKLESVLEWLMNLTEPVTVSGPEFCEKFGFHPSDKTKIRSQLADLGTSFEVTRVGTRYLTTFHPLRDRRDLDRSRNAIKSFRKIVPLDADTGYLIGYWLGDGWIRRNKSTLDYGQWGICYSSKSARSCASAEYLKPILDRIGVEWSEVTYGPTREMVQILGYNDVFTRWLAANFGHTKEDKHLPDWVFDAPRDFLFGLLRGLIDSDGCVTVKKTGVVTVQLAMSTKPLMDQVVLLMQSLGLPPSVHLHKSRDVRMPDGSVTRSCKPLWQAAFSDSEAVTSFIGSGFLAKAVDVRVPANPGWGCKHRIYDGLLHYRVKAVSSAFYEGPVYSLNVDEDHSFYANRIWHANCLRTLVYQDKLRQAQTSIASRAMTPKRVIWADKMSEPDVENLRDQIDQAIIDPDFSIIMNFEVHWDEVGSRDRLLDLGTEYEITNKLLFIGLRITESMLTGESTYSGERIHLDVMNTMYLLYRETLAQFVEDYLFAPVAEKKGFWEEDEYGNRVLLYPKLQFTRLALRDNSELQDFMFNLYNKGSLPISFILELLNIDADETLAQLKRDMFTPNDANFNEFLRTVMTKAGEEALEETDVLDKLATSAGLKMSKKKGDRFGGGEGEK